jgi:hypothetical protein
MLVNDGPREQATMHPIESNYRCNTSIIFTLSAKYMQNPAREKHLFDPNLIGENIFASLSLSI